VKLLFKQEGNPGSAQKMEAQQVQELLRELEQFGFGMKQEIESVEGVLKKTLDIKKKFSEFLERKFLVSVDDLLEFMLELHNSPIKFTKIENHIVKLFNGQEKQVNVVHQEVARRITEENKDLSLRYFRDAEEISKSHGAVVLGAKEIWKVCRQEVQKITKYSEELIQSLPMLNFADFCLLSRKVPERGYEHLKGELWLAKVRFLQIFCDSLIKPSNPITLEEVRSFLPEIEPYVSSLVSSKRVPFEEHIGFLNRLLHEIEMWIEAEREELIESGKRILGRVLYGFIDVTKEVAKPSAAEKQQKPAGLKLDSKEHPSQLPSLNGKRSRIDNKTKEIDENEKIEKKMKIHNEIHQSILCSLGVEIPRKSIPEGLKIEELDEKKIVHNWHC